MKNHANWVLTAAMLALALEGWQDVFGETLSHVIGMSKSSLGVFTAIGLGWMWSAVYEARDEPPHHHRPPRVRKRRTPKSH